MSDYLEIGTTPVDEECAQVGTDGYEEKVTREIEAFKAQIMRQFPKQCKRVKLIKKSFPHDFGSYYELCIVFEQRECDAAFEIENNLPAEWDEEAREFLKK